MQIFIIAPVSNVPADVSRRLDVHVTELERQGHQVHWAERDTTQTDRFGLNSYLADLSALRMAVEVHIWYDADCWESVFDVGALVMCALTAGLKKRIVLLNRDEIMSTPDKSFANVVLALAGASRSEVRDAVKP
ncbi:MAG TPA: hypothetical protein VJB15_12225 [Rhodothermia bacterium]|nr:hypothetical protein [Rhodothermia bacterium]